MLSCMSVASHSQTTPTPSQLRVSRDEVLLAISYLDGSVACGRVTLGLNHVSVSRVSPASCPLPVSPDASLLCHSSGPMGDD